MSVPRIYADFNGLVAGAKNPSRTAVVLDTFGSLRDLSNAGILLEEGIELIAVDASDDIEDLEGHGTAQYDRDNARWVIEFDEIGVRYVPAGDRSHVDQFLCVRCRAPLDVRATYFNSQATCPFCGMRIIAPYDPPAAAG